MASTLADLTRFLDTHVACAKVTVVEALGSTPREQGAWMLVAQDTIFGTIGGGQLEFMAIDRARVMLASEPGGGSAQLSIPLGPEIGQCCGGRVQLSIEPVGTALRTQLIAEAEAEQARLPHVVLFGGGHVGRALAAALALLPVRPVVVETRAEAVADFPAGVETHVTAVPEEFVRNAPNGSAFVVLTHDHALDFLIVAEALKRADAAYVGMIGSATKKATFRNWYLKTAGSTQTDVARLVCPIGGSAVRDKRPAVIAALAAAEIVAALSR